MNLTGCSTVCPSCGPGSSGGGGGGGIEWPAEDKGYKVVEPALVQEKENSFRFTFTAEKIKL